MPSTAVIARYRIWADKLPKAKNSQVNDYGGGLSGTAFL
jgi:hypothetical protein